MPYTKSPRSTRKTAAHHKEERVGNNFLKMERMWQYLMPGLKLLP